MIKKIRKIYDWLTLSHLTRGLSDVQSRAIRMTSNVQIVMFLLPTILIPSVLIVEPPETHFYSFMAYSILVTFFVVGRILLHRNYVNASAAVTLANINIHFASLCIAYPDDPAYLGFLISAILPFLMISSKPRLRWVFVIFPIILFFGYQYYYRVMGGHGIFGPPKWVVNADYIMPPIFLATFFLIMIIYQFVKAVDQAEEKLSKEYAKSEKLILNILPEEIANELKQNGSSKPSHIESATVCFTDFEGFTRIAESLTPSELVQELDSCFSHFDKIMERYNLEKLKTIGDSYMFAGGIPATNQTHAVDCVMAALEIQDFMNQLKMSKNQKGLPYWELRLGMHSGNLVAGVIGEKKFAYDVWSDTVNIASRCESSGVVGKINVSDTTYERIKNFFVCEYRGPIEAKSKGKINMYFILGLLPELRHNHQPLIPNEEFHKRYAELKGVAEVLS